MNWIIFPGRDEHKTSLKPPTRIHQPASLALACKPKSLSNFSWLLFPNHPADRGMISRRFRQFRKEEFLRAPRTSHLEDHPMVSPPIGSGCGIPSKWPIFMAYKFTNRGEASSLTNWDDPPSTPQKSV